MTTGHFGCPWCHLWDKWWECIGCASAFEWIFFDIPQAKNHQSHHWCQDQGEVLSCWHHSRFLGPFGSCVQLVPTLLASQRHVADFLHGQKSVRRGFSSCYKHGFQNQLLSCVGAMISARMRKKLPMGVGGRGRGEFEGWGGPENEHTLPKSIALFYHSKAVRWHDTPSAEMPQKHAQGLWRIVFLLGHMGSCAWEGIWLTLSMMPSARSVHFSFNICVILLLCTHSKWQTTCVFYLFERN